MSSSSHETGKAMCSKDIRQQIFYEYIDEPKNCKRHNLDKKSDFCVHMTEKQIKKKTCPHCKKKIFITLESDEEDSSSDYTSISRLNSNFEQHDYSPSQHFHSSRRNTHSLSQHSQEPFKTSCQNNTHSDNIKIIEKMQSELSNKIEQLQQVEKNNQEMVKLLQTNKTPSTCSDSENFPNEMFRKLYYSNDQHSNNRQLPSRTFSAADSEEYKDGISMAQKLHSYASSYKHNNNFDKPSNKNPLMDKLYTLSDNDIQFHDFKEKVAKNINDKVSDLMNKAFQFGYNEGKVKNNK